MNTANEATLNLLSGQCRVGPADTVMGPRGWLVSNVCVEFKKKFKFGGWRWLRGKQGITQRFGTEFGDC